MKTLSLNSTFIIFGLVLGSTSISSVMADATSSPEATPSPCPTEGTVYTKGNLQIDMTSTSKGCTLMAHPVSEPAAYRSVSLGYRGIVQIFNKYNVPGGTVSNSTGARTFFVFPRKQIPSFMPPLADDKGVKLLTSSGDLILVDPNPSKWNLPLKFMTSSDDPSFQVTESSVMSKKNSGGVDISLTSEADLLLLDTGFAMGGASFTNPNRSSVFYDWRGNHCVVSNRAIFNFSDSDADLKWSNDQELFKHVKVLCPNISFPDVETFQEMPITMPDRGASKPDVSSSSGVNSEPRSSAD
jgi:hypothetical protein